MQSQIGTNYSKISRRKLCLILETGVSRLNMRPERTLMFQTYTRQQMSLPSINFLHLDGRGAPV